MSILSSAALYRIWAQTQTSLAAIPNTTGTWTTTGAKYVPFNKLSITRVDPLISAKYKTGTGSQLAGVPGGKKYGIIDSAEFPLMPSGAPGTPPMHDAVLQAIFGGPPTTVASTSVTYGFADGAGVPLILGKFNEAAGGGNTNQFAYGVVPKNFSINIGGNGEIIVTFDGVSFYVLESDNFANEDTTGKAGLTVYPAEPGSPAITGTMVPSFAQTITIGGTSIPEFTSMNIKGSGLRDFRMDTTNGFYGAPNGVVQGIRQVMLSSLTFADSSGAGLSTLKNARQSKSALDVIVTQGNVAGYTVTHTVRGVQFGNAKFSDDGSGGVNCQFDDSPAHASAMANVNEYSLQLT